MRSDMRSLAMLNVDTMEKQSSRLVVDRFVRVNLISNRF